MTNTRKRSPWNAGRAAWRSPRRAGSACRIWPGRVLSGRPRHRAVGRVLPQRRARRGAAAAWRMAGGTGVSRRKRRMRPQSPRQPGGKHLMLWRHTRHRFRSDRKRHSTKSLSLARYPLGERDDVQARRHQLPRPGLGNLRRSRFDARGTRRQRWLPQPAVLGSLPNFVLRPILAATLCVAGARPII
jgi:hypothetical protein